MRYKHDGAF